MATAVSTFVFFVVYVGLSAQTACSANSLGFEFHHRFSDKVRKWAESGNLINGHWPEKESVEYYAALAENDRIFRERKLAGTNSPVTFSAGNETIRKARLGFLHYAEVSVGTPSQNFLVALDTGSDLFWLPCDCKSCGPTSNPGDGLKNGNFSIYSPRSSSSSQSIPCSSSFCELQSQCQAAQNQCPYTVRYLSENTSTTGVLVQDVLHLITDDAQKETVQAKIVIGCGQIQTGHFLDASAPNGLFGLGLDPISVPSVLTKAGITSNSFSMCFSEDGSGRIRFGDKGSSDQAETPFKINPRAPRYVVAMSGIRIGRYMLTGSLHAIMDTGTSFTYLTDPAYSLIGQTFDRQITDQRVSLGPNFPFEYCYSLSDNSRAPAIGLIMEGGQEFLVRETSLVLATDTGRKFYCLGITKSDNIDIIGQNFMTGNLIVFDRDRNVLGWKQFDCYDSLNSSNWTVRQAAPPSAAVSPYGYNPEETVNNNRTMGVGPANSSAHSLRACFCGLILSILSFLL